ncbi:MAG: DUF5060 domain-containing protein [Cyclobacteriaceae bacterium]
MNKKQYLNDYLLRSAVSLRLWTTFTTLMAGVCCCIGGVDAQNVTEYLEENGLLIIEAENLLLTDSWKRGSDVKGFSGPGYIYWSGADHFNEPGNGLIKTRIKITTPGRYRFRWRGRVGYGADFTEFNDTWLAFPDASDFYAVKENKRVYPKGSNKTPEPKGAGKNGWLKIFHTGDIGWDYSANTSDNEGYQPYVEFEKEGSYTMLISARSRLHLIDRIVMHTDDILDPTNLHHPSTAVSSNYTPPVLSKTKEVVVEGDPMVWHTISLSFKGPGTSETANPNPFADYLLSVDFTHTSGKTYTISGFYAACGEAVDNSCQEGNIWRALFVPDRVGEWRWKASFYEGKDAALGAESKQSKFIHGLKGKFTIETSDKSGKDFRSASKGRLQYVGEHYLRFSGSNQENPVGDWFIKAGADAVENTLDYEDFDSTPNRKNLRKSWGPHSGDFDPAEASSYTWAGGKGKNILGMVNYLSTEGLNAFSFLTFTLAGDDQNVFPHLMKVPVADYEELNPEEQWKNGVYHDRFDCSKLDQWDKVFSYADLKGMYLHFKLGEEENESLMDNGNLGRERRLYYRELIARFGHHLALNWNIGEENGPPVEPFMTDQQRIETINYLSEIDPYKNHIVLHTRPDLQDTVYTHLLGEKSALTGASLQCVNNEVVHSDVKRWIRHSDSAGKKWVVANDEQGTYKIGVSADADRVNNNVADNRKEVRHQVLWGTLMAGGAGVEYYYGYQTGCGDLDCQDHRTRQTKWHDARNALRFFDSYLQTFLPHMRNMDDITAVKEDYVLGISGKIYAIYLPNGGSTKIKLPQGNWSIQWYDPAGRTPLLSSSEKIENNSITAPSEDDWVGLISIGK